MHLVNPFASISGHPEEESFGDFPHLEQSEPTSPLPHDASDPDNAERRRGSGGSDQTAVDVDENGRMVLPNLVTLARVYLADHMPTGYVVYDDQMSCIDLEACANQNRQWKKTYFGSTDPDRPDLKRRGSNDSTNSARSDAPDLDENDPRLTGVAPNNDDIIAWRKEFEEKEGRPPSRSDEFDYYHSQSASVRRHCLLRLGKALIKFGAPTHRLEGIMKASRRALGLREAHFIVLPSLMIISFGDGHKGSTDMRLIKTPAALDLGRLSETYALYKDLTHSRLGAVEVAEKLGELLRPERQPFWGKPIRCFFGFITAFMVCPMAFGGSLIDACLSGVFGLFVSVMSLYASARAPQFATLYEVVAVIVVSCVSQALAAIQNEKYVCYSAVSTAGVVSLLPGFLILSSSQEIAAKHAMSGSIKMVYAVVYALFLGFSLDFGSQLYLMGNSRENNLQIAAFAYLNPKTIVGKFTWLGSNTTLFWPRGDFTYTPARAPISNLDNHFITSFCQNSPSWPWYLQPWGWQSLFVLVPLYILASACRNLQPFTRQRKDVKQIVAMVIIACCSYAANRSTSKYFNRSESITAVGAVVVGLLGNLYSRVFKGYAYPAMVPGVLFLIPSGISSVGGQSYTGQNITVRILQVSIGVTVGLGLSNYVVYNAASLIPRRLGGRKSTKEAVFAF